MRNTIPTAYTAVPIGVTVYSGHDRRNQRSRCRNPPGHLRRTIGHVPGTAGHVGPEYSEVPGIISGLKNSATKKLMMASGGANPTGNPCEGNHWHGFIGMEQQAVIDISTWIKKPTAD